MINIQCQVDEYIPKLIGMRPLENGRLALAFDNKESGQLEVRIYNVWKVFPRESVGAKYLGWYEPDTFKKAYLFGSSVYWTEDVDLYSDILYLNSVLVEGDFHCVV